MKAAQFLQDSIGEIKAEYVAEAKEKSKVGIYKTFTAAACFVLIVAVAVTAVINIVPPIVFTTEITLTAEEISHVFPVAKAGTSFYETKYTAFDSSFGSDNVAYSKYLPIYHNKSTVSKEKFIKLVKKYAKHTEQLYEVNINLKDIVVESGDSYDYNQRTYYGGKSIGFTLNDNQFKMKYSSSTGMRLEIDNEYVMVYDYDSDDKIINLLSGLIEEHNDALGKSYDKIVIQRNYNEKYLTWMYVYCYDSRAETAGFSNSENPVAPDYLRLELCTKAGVADMYSWYGGYDEVYLSSICYYETVKDWHKFMSKGKMITLEQAEEYLNKGYAFGGHSCFLCMANQAEVAFSDWDEVALEYINGENGLIVPFYAFYKRLEVNENGMQKYACTYVPAVYIEGMEEYFAAQREWHEKYKDN